MGIGREGKAILTQVLTFFSHMLSLKYHPLIRYPLTLSLYRARHTKEGPVSFLPPPFGGEGGEKKGIKRKKKKERKKGKEIKRMKEEKIL